MNPIPQDQIIGIDVSRDWLDIHCLPEGQYARIPNTDAGHQGLTKLARRSGAIVCFEATGGQEWRLWAVLDAAGVEARQLPPAQIKAFATSRGTRAKTDRIDAELIARFRHQNMRNRAFGGQPALDQPGRCWGLRDPVGTNAAGVFGTDCDNHA